jgi:hypothetical protein
MRTKILTLGRITRLKASISLSPLQGAQDCSRGREVSLKPPDQRSRPSNNLVHVVALTLLAVLAPMASASEPDSKPEAPQARPAPFAVPAPAPTPVPGPAFNNEPLINHVRLLSTQIVASSVNGGRPQDNEFYGPLNLADGGENFINNINYTYWLTDHNTVHWVQFRFDEPVQIRFVMLEFPHTGPALSAERPQECALDVAWMGADGERRERKLSSTKIEGFRCFYPLPQDEPLPPATELKIVFPGPSMIAVSEVEVLGPPPAQGSLALKPTRPRVEPKPVEKEVSPEEEDVPLNVHRQSLAR